MGGRLGVEGNQWFAIEASGGFASNELDPAVGPKIKLTDVGGNLVITPWAGSRGGIFLYEGFGWGRFKAEGGPKDSDIDMGLLNSAAGVMVNITDLIGIRLEGRHLFWIPKDDINSAHIGHWLVGGGLTFNIGGASKVDSDQD